MIRRPPRSTQSRSSAASDVYKRQDQGLDSRIGHHTPSSSEYSVREPTHGTYRLQNRVVPSCASNTACSGCAPGPLEPSESQVTAQRLPSRTAWQRDSWQAVREGSLCAVTWLS